MNDIKDKKNLTDARKLIESKMEQFKVRAFVRGPPRRVGSDACMDIISSHVDH